MSNHEGTQSHLKNRGVREPIDQVKGGNESGFEVAVSDDSMVSAHSDLIISGDVDSEMGDIEVDGAIEVRGCVRDGLRLVGKSLRAEQILKAEIDIAGDIMVSGGVIGARVRAGGKVSAEYIHNARIEAAGGIYVENEIHDSAFHNSTSS